MLQRPLHVLNERAADVAQGVDITHGKLLYMLDSAHDDQLANLILWLAPLNYDLVDVPYASSVYFELHYDEDARFSVHVLHDGKPLKIKECIDANREKGSGSEICSLEEFNKYMDKIMVKGDIQQMCDR